MPEKSKVNVVLSGGSARGLSHLGVLSVLEKHFEISSIIGTSMGAILGGLYCYGYSTQEIIKLVKEIKNYKIISIFKPSFKKSGILDGNSLLNYFEEKTKNINIEQCRINFAAVAFDMKSARTVLIDKGSLGKAIRASSSLPMIIEPFIYGSNIFVDGYIEHPLPLKFARHFGKNIVVASSVLPPLPEDNTILNPEEQDIESDLPSMLNGFFKSMLYSQGSMAIQSTLAHKPDIYISSFSQDLNLWELDEVDEFYSIGKDAAEKALAEYFEDKDNSKQNQFFDDLSKAYNDVIGYFKTLSE